MDLGEVYEIGEIIISWESIQSPFTLYISENGSRYSLMGIYSSNEAYINELNLYGEKARYLQISIPKGGFCSIFEFEVYEATEEDKTHRPAGVGGKNIAKDKTVTATEQEGSYKKEYAVDGDYNTRWGSLPTGQAWLQVDLGELVKIQSITAYLEAAWVPYRIEISKDGNTYETIYSAKKDELVVQLAGIGKEARYVRFYREGENWFSIMELEIYQ